MRTPTTGTAPSTAKDPMKLSTQLMYAGNPREAADQVAALEKAGLDTVWVAEAYGFDSPTLMGYLAAKTETVEIGSAILNVYSRTPGALAQTAAGLDNVSGGRAILGLGASGPQVIEGWHGVAYDKPLGRTREVVDIVREALRREPLDHDGRSSRSRCPTDQGTGLGKPLKMLTQPERAGVPIYIAALGQKNVEGTAEYADGWLPFLFAPEKARRGLGRRARRAAPRSARPTSARWRSSPAAWSRSARTSRRCSTSPARCSRSTSAAWAPRARTSTTTWPASTATRRRPSRSRTSTSAATSATPRRWCRPSCWRCATWSAPRPTSRSGSPPSREAGVTNLQVMPVPADAGSRPPSSAAQGVGGLMTESTREHLRPTSTRPSAVPSAPSSRRRSSPTTTQWEADGHRRREVWTKAGEQGLLCFDVPEEYGGPGVADFRYNLVLAEELTRAGANGPGFPVHTDIIVPYLTSLGTDEQKQRWLPGCVSGETITAIAMTEPGAGSDLQGIRTTPSTRATTTSSTAPRPSSATASCPTW